MTISSISSSAISSLALFGLNDSTNQITASTYRLSTGDRFYRAGDDVAALSISNRLQSNIVGLDQALSNNLQANSMLQTAYSGLSEIGDILDTMLARATTANSGTLTAAERAALDLEFQELREEVDRIANETSFNGINLIDGSVSQSNSVITSTSNSTQSTGSINFTAAIGGGQTVVLNGVTFTEGVDFAAGATATDTATNLFTALSSSNDVNVRGVEFGLAGTAINITARAGGTLGDQFLIDEASSTGSGSFTVAGQATAQANVFGLQGGEDDGLFLGGTTVTGTIGDSLVNTQDQTIAEQTLTIVSNAAIDNNENFLRIDDGVGGTITFRARTATLVNPEDFLRGATAEETLQNFVDTVRQYSTDDDFVLNQLEFEIQGDSVIIRGRTPGNVLDQTGANAALTEGMNAAEGFISGTSLNNGVNTGVNTDGVVNADFTGTITGFSATFNSGNNITAEITVGDETYTADITDTNVGADTFVRFVSSGGGYFDVELSGGNGFNVADQTDADTYAARLDAAFSTLTFTQDRTITNFSGAGQLAGGNATFASEDFTNVSIDEISVISSASTGGDSVLELDIDGEIFRSTSLGDSIGGFESVVLRSLSDPNHSLTITNGSTAVDLSTDAAADTFADSLRSNFNLENGDGELEFQVGFNSTDRIGVAIDSATSDSLFDGASPDLLSQANAAIAEDVINDALDELGEILAEVGAAQSRLDFAFNAATATRNELELARAELADTDIPSESTLYANAIVQQQASIAVLAQTQQLGSNLLDLLQIG